MRHTLAVSVEKEWYSLASSTSLPIYMYAREESEEREGRKEDRESVKMEIPTRDDMDDGEWAETATAAGTGTASAYLELPSRVIDLNGPLEGIVKVQRQLQYPLETIQLRLIRREFIGRFCNEESMLVHTLVGNAHALPAPKSTKYYSKGVIARTEEGWEDFGEDSGEIEPKRQGKDESTYSHKVPTEQTLLSSSHRYNGLMSQIISLSFLSVSSGCLSCAISMCTSFFLALFYRLSSSYEDTYDTTFCDEED